MDELLMRNNVVVVPCSGSKSKRFGAEMEQVEQRELEVHCVFNTCVLDGNTGIHFYPPSPDCLCEGSAG